MGKVLDEVCKLGKIHNENNVPNAPMLHLFDLSTGETLPFECKMEELTNIKSGDPILLEYSEAK